MFWTIVGAILFVTVVLPIIWTVLVWAWEIAREGGCSWFFWLVILIVFFCIIL